MTSKLCRVDTTLFYVCVLAGIGKNTPKTHVKQSLIETPAKKSSKNAVCICRLLQIFAIII